ncbi:fungal specific transcription factor domain-containing protein [Aspergillus foveolatus]|uniref:fungal specific transcription factor domain-containing protein n=1 Tax=Aspergillus foveolatus TaxID=210207 RepID=UPI003CCDC2AC
MPVDTPADVRLVLHHTHRTNATESRATSELVIEGQYFDLTSGLSFLHRATSKLSAQRGQYIAHGYHDIQQNQFFASAGDQPFYQGNSSAEADVLPDDGTSRERLSFYFDTCVVTYRMFHRQTVEQWLARMLRNREQGRCIAHSLGNARTASILAILAIAGLRCFKLNRKHSALGGQADYIEQQCAKRVFWTAYTVDKYISVVLGRPRLMHDEGIDQEFPDLVNDENMGPEGLLTSDAREECHVWSLIHHAKCTLTQFGGRRERFN